MRRILFFGSRTLDGGHLPPIVARVVELNRKYGKDGWVMVNGLARGADNLARAVALDYGVKVEGYRAQWDVYGKRAGYLRNVEMRDSGVDEAYGFVDKPIEESKGSAMMVDLLNEVGIEPNVTVLKPAPK